MPHLRPAPRLLEQVPNVPYLFPRSGPEGRNPRRAQGELVRSERKNTMNTDPIADLLTRIRNAARAKHARVDVPASKLKTEIARILKEEGYISTFKLVDENKVRKTLRLFLKYTPDRRSVGATRIRAVVGGLGISILTTPRGLMTGRAARRARVGGEVLCEIW